MILESETRIRVPKLQARKHGYIRRGFDIQRRDVLLPRLDQMTPNNACSSPSGTATATLGPHHGIQPAEPKAEKNQHCFCREQVPTKSTLHQAQRVELATYFDGRDSCSISVMSVVSSFFMLRKRIHTTEIRLAYRHHSAYLALPNPPAAQ